MNAKVLVVLVVVAVVGADSLFGSDSIESREANYGFDWAVKDSNNGNNFGQEETRAGDNTQGSHFVILPDGRRQTVTYYVDGDSGFIVDVKYSGEARFDSVSREIPRFSAPSRPRPSAPRRPSAPVRSARPSTPFRHFRPNSFSRESFEVRSPFSRNTDERFDFSFDRSREDRFPSRSVESHEFFRVPPNPFIRNFLSK